MLNILNREMLLSVLAFCLVFPSTSYSSESPIIANEGSRITKADIVWMEDFESGWNGWYPDNGVWEVGIPTYGPSSGHSGSKCAGSILAGDAPGNASTRLISPEFTVPSADHNPRLKFYCWFMFGTNDGGMVQISVDYGNWETISSYYDNGSPAWTQSMVDLTAYANSSVRIGFYFGSDTYFPGAGWYIDDVSLVTGPVEFNNPEDFETGIGDWCADNGLWEVGVPTYGPSSGHSGSKCAGTILAGDAPGLANTRLISPEFTVPGAGQHPRLKFYNWFWFGTNDGGMVQISVDYGNWETVSSYYDNGSYVWTQSVVDLTAYAGSTVRIGFYFGSDTYFPGAGWYIDDVSLVTGPYQFNMPEDFETGPGDWSADNGLWEVGIPTFGPDSAYSGSNCSGTILGGDYTSDANSRWITSPFTVPSADHNPKLWFYHWYSFGASDYGWIQISVNGGNWVNLVSQPFSESSPVWTPFMVLLSDYAGENVRIGFYFTSSTYFAGAGWYIDHVYVDPDPKTPVFINNFEAVALGTGVNLRWDITSDEEIRGFKIYRKNAENEAEPMIDVSDLIPPEIRQYLDISIKSGRRYSYLLTVVKSDYSEQPSQMLTVTTHVYESALYQNYPNPFNPATTISFTLPKITNVNLSIFNIEGKLMNTLIDGTITEGYNQVQWDGTDSNNNTVSSGVYFYRLNTGNAIMTKKMVLLK
jgi:hypothetical protein